MDKYRNPTGFALGVVLALVVLLVVALWVAVTLVPAGPCGPDGQPCQIERGPGGGP